jgi:hypothetical protein
MALTYTRVGRQTLGNKVLTITLVTGDGSETSITALGLQLSRIECAWLSDVDDAQELYLSTWKGSAIVVDTAIQSGQKQLVFAIGS